MGVGMCEWWMGQWTQEFDLTQFNITDASKKVKKYKRQKVESSKEKYYLSYGFHLLFYGVAF